MLFNIFNRVLYEAEGATGAGAESGTTSGTAAALSADGGQEAPALPWSDSQDVWQVGDKPWYELVGDEGVRKTLEAKQYKNPAVLGQAYSELLKLQNGSPNVVDMPGEDATPDDWNAFYDKKGRPASASEYKLEPAEGLTIDDGMMEFGKGLFHKLGLNQNEASLAFKEWNEYQVSQLQAQAEQYTKDNDAAIQALKDSWGPELDSNVAAGQRAYAALGMSDAEIKTLEENIGVASVVSMLAKLGKLSAEHGFVGDGGKAADDVSSMNKQQAEAEIARLQTDEAFMKRYEAGDKDAVAKMERLFSRTV